MLVNNAGVGIGAPMAEIQTKHLDMQLGVNLRALIIGTREGLPMLREAGAEHGKALIVNTASIAGKAGQGWLSIYAATKAAVINFTEGDPPRGGRRRHPVHGAGPGLRRHADDRVRQGPGARRGDDPARGHRRGGALPAAHLAQLPRARRSSSPGPVRASAAPSPPGGRRRPANLRLLLAAFGDPGHVFPAIALGRALAERGHEVTVETWEERRAAVEGAGLGFTAAEEYRMFPPPDPDSEDGAHAAEAARALLPLLEEMRPHAVVSDILTLAPALAAEKAGRAAGDPDPPHLPGGRAGPALLRDRPAAAAHAARARRSGGRGRGR